MIIFKDPFGSDGQGSPFRPYELKNKNNFIALSNFVSDASWHKYQQII